MSNFTGKDGDEYQKAVKAAMENASKVPIGEAAAKINSPEGLAKAVSSIAPLLDKIPSMVPAELKEAFEVATPAMKAITETLGKPGFPGMNRVMGMMASLKVAEAFEKIAAYDKQFCQPSK
ncbi:MAG: hypothetical protein ACK47R_25295 [Planctomycetia bacterium]